MFHSGSSPKTSVIIEYRKRYSHTLGDGPNHLCDGLSDWSLIRRFEGEFPPPDHGDSQSQGNRTHRQV